ncbi:hypothetical protein HMI54_014648 [Coelomomyces lativittatus]|nr:hypothetical protein HMI54_014648 [Coelomomyces lativittatus]
MDKRNERIRSEFPHTSRRRRTESPNSIQLSIARRKEFSEEIPTTPLRRTSLSALDSVKHPTMAAFSEPVYFRELILNIFTKNPPNKANFYSD